MLILGIDTATQVCTVALLKDDEMLAEYTLNIKKTHSQRLFPLVDSLLRDTGTEKNEIDAIAVAAGPGSFTGIRIGVATARGLAQGLKIPAVGVSTLEALAENIVTGSNEIVCPLLDARRNEVYTALYRFSETIMEPSAMSIEKLADILAAYTERVFFPGDGLPKYGEFLRREMGARFGELKPFQGLNRASSVARCALKKMVSDPGDYSLNSLLPIYVRLPEAERMALGKDS